jgi:hypothetical protein
MAELDDLIAAWTSGQKADSLLGQLPAGSVPAGRIYQARDMFSDPHFAARQAIVRLAHPELGELPMQNVFPRLSAAPGRIRRPGPELGEHNDDVYRGLLGLGDSEITELAAANVIRVASVTCVTWRLDDLPAWHRRRRYRHQRLAHRRGDGRHVPGQDRVCRRTTSPAAYAELL